MCNRGPLWSEGDRTHRKAQRGHRTQGAIKMSIRKSFSAATAVIALGAFGVAGLGPVSGAGASSPMTTTSSKNVVQIAEHNPEFTTLVAAIKAAGLVQTLEGPGPFTVFAPTNKAFAALPKGTLKTLLKPANKAELASILDLPRRARCLEVLSDLARCGQNGQRCELHRELGEREADDHRREGHDGSDHQDQHHRFQRRDPRDQRRAAAVIRTGPSDRRAAIERFRRSW